MLDRPIQIGRLTLPNRVFLAPLAGVTDVPFRRICGEFGAGLTFVEMLSAGALVMGSPTTRALMVRHADERILGAQITGKTAEIVGRAVAVCDREGFDLIDINMGCPVRKIVGSGCGASYLKDPERVAPAVEAARAATARPLSVKCRLGYQRGEPVAGRVLADAVRAGAEMVTLHGRFRGDTYGVPADYGAIGEGLAGAREAAGDRPLVTVGNGDVMDADSARSLVRQSGCDAVMVSRGALGNPWIFREILDGRPNHPAIAEWAEVVLRHIDYHEAAHGGSVFSARRLRKHLLWYASGFPRTNRLRDRFNVVDSLPDARELIRGYAACYPADLRRYEDPDSARRTAEHDPKHQMDREADRAAAGDEP